MPRIELPFKIKRPVLACGADIKSAFALAEGGSAFLFDGFGDLGYVDNLERYERAVRRATRDLKIHPEIIACDLHPGYFSSQFAERSILNTRYSILKKIQHHEAHIASAIVDKRIKGGVIGIAFDGTGFGADGNIWGGEFFVGGPKKFIRVAHFEYIPMPGGEAAVREPRRMAASHLYRAYGSNFLKNFSKRGQAPFNAIKEMIDKGVNSPLTSSAGRLFDAVGSIALDKKEAAFEAELPMKLERIADTSCGLSYDFDVKSEDGMSIVSFSRTIKGIVRDMEKGVKRAVVSAKFHNTVAKAVSGVSVLIRRKFSAKKAVLSGGVFQNKYLLKRAVGLMESKGFEVFTHRAVPTNDGGIPIGQIAIANARV